MADKTLPQSQEPATTAATEVSFCPHLALYHYRRLDGSEYFFDAPQLEKSIQAYLDNGDPLQAEFMAMLTGLARQRPHEVLSFDEKGQMTLRVLTPETTLESSDGAKL